MAAAKTLASKKASQTAAQTKALSEEVVVDSDNSDDDEDSDNLDSRVKGTAPVSKAAIGIRPIKTAVTAVKEDLESEEEDDDGDSDNESATTESSSEEDVTPVSQSTKASIGAAETNGSKRKTSSQEETTAETESIEDTRASKKARLAEQTTAAIPSRAYLPPDGYRRVESPGTSDLNPAQLRQKTTFHITASAAVPLSLLQSISIKAIKSGRPLFTHEGTEYVIVEIPTDESTILLPDSSGYKVSSQPVTRSYSVRPSFTLPTIPARAAARDAGSGAAANIATAAVTSIRPQPKGLKMRYKPPGFGRGDPGVVGGDSDDEQDNSGSIFQFPRAVGLSTDGDGVMLADGSAKRKKKHKTSTQASNGIDAHKQPVAETPAKPASLKKLSNQAHSINDDEARRKAEKMAKKAAKRQLVNA